FFFQAEDGIRDLTVTGVQTCALPILILGRLKPAPRQAALAGADTFAIIRSKRSPTRTSFSNSCWDRRIRKWRSICEMMLTTSTEIGRASCRERVEISAGCVVIKKTKI